jgi:hypothetical protein
MSDTGITMIAMHNALRPAFEEWLASRGLLLGKIPDPEMEETWIVTPTQERWEELSQENTWSGRKL